MCALELKMILQSTAE